MRRAASLLLGLAIAAIAVPSVAFTLTDAPVNQDRTPRFADPVSFAGVTGDRLLQRAQDQRFRASNPQAPASWDQPSGRR